MTYNPGNSPEHTILVFILAGIIAMVLKRKILTATLIVVPLGVFAVYAWPHIAPHQALIWEYLRPLLMTLSLAAPVLLVAALNK